MRKAFSIYILLLGISVFSQDININFDSINLSKWEESIHDHWHVDTTAPINGTGSLHHNFDASDASFDMISYRHKQLLLDSSTTEWQFSVKYNYSPSSGNNWAFWLASSQSASEMHPSGSGEGYIIGVNYSGSDDIVKIWRQGFSNKTAIITTQFNWQDNISNGDIVNLKISRSVESEWLIQIDTSGTEFFTVGTGIDSVYNKSEYLGVYYEYTSTKDRLLWIDNIALKGTFYEDTESPIVKSFLIQERNKMVLFFNEELDTMAGTSFILAEKYNPIKILWINSTSVVLSFENAFMQNNLLEIFNLTDLKNNVSQLEQVRFNYFAPEFHDVIISEIMADPNPQIELPECEYVELFNSSRKELNLKAWSLVSGQRSPAILNEFILKPNSYVLLVDDGCSEEFPDSISKISLPSLPTLPNTGETIVLKDKYGQLIHKLTYNNDWYNDELKEDGGWSLEIIDANYPCVITNNWKASISDNGGTPGYINSISGQMDYYPTARLLGISEITGSSCKVTFSETLDSISATQTSNYILLKSNISISSALPISPFFKEVKISFSEGLITGSLYSLSVKKVLHDCSGMSVKADLLTFGVPQKADSADLVINEILFEASDDVPEFIELYNKSAKVIDLNMMRIASLDSYSDTIKTSKEIVSVNYQLFPHCYVVLTDNKNELLQKFSNLSATVVIEPDSWLRLSNTGGEIALLNMQNKMLDKAIYMPKMHFALLKNTSGISLERISVFQSGMNTKNWHSAATGINYASPGEANSQRYEKDNGLSLVSLSSKEISPDNDGWNDLVTINYNFPKSGYIANVKIYSQRGELKNTLVNNELCGISGSFVWDGLDENNGRLAMGYYIIYFEAWQPDGDIIKEKMIILLLPE